MNYKGIAVEIYLLMKINVDPLAGNWRSHWIILCLLGTNSSLLKGASLS